MATISKTPEGTWRALVRKKGWPCTSKNFRTKRDAQDWARRIEDEMVRGAYIQRSASEQTTLSEALDRYLKEFTPQKKFTTQVNEKKRAEQLRSVLGSYSIAAISPTLVANYRDSRLEAGRSTSTVRLELALLGHLFTVAIKEWRLGLVMNSVSMIRRPSPAQGRNRRLAEGEEARLLAECDAHSNPMLGWVVRIALYTGMRRGEILTLTRDQVDLSRRIVRLTNTKNGSARTVPLSKSAFLVFEQAFNHPVQPKDTDLIFFGEPGKDGIRRAYTLNKVWETALKRAKITGLRFHDLRHEAVSRLVEKGLSDQEVSAVSGHKSMQMLKRYTHLRAEDLVKKLDAVD